MPILDEMFLLAPRCQPCHRACGSSGFEVGCRELALLAALDIEADLLALGKGAESGALDRRDVDEDILRAVIRLDEALALHGIEPFDRALHHRMSPCARQPATCEPKCFPK